MRSKASRSQLGCLNLLDGLLDGNMSSFAIESQKSVFDSAI